MTKKYAILSGDYVINLIVSEETLESFDGLECIEYSPSGEFRSNSAQIGGTYLREEDVFIDRQPYSSWVLDPSTYKWNPPIAKPDGPAAWDESKLGWNTPE
jgi:hypothetical protein